MPRTGWLPHDEADVCQRPTGRPTEAGTEQPARTSFQGKDLRELLGTDLTEQRGEKSSQGKTASRRGLRKPAAAPEHQDQGPWDPRLRGSPAGAAESSEQPGQMPGTGGLEAHDSRSSSGSEHNLRCRNCHRPSPRELQKVPLHGTTAT